jgi:hypothetical protein
MCPCANTWNITFWRTQPLDYHLHIMSERDALIPPKAKRRDISLFHYIYYMRWTANPICIWLYIYTQYNINKTSLQHRKKLYIYNYIMYIYIYIYYLHINTSVYTEYIYSSVKLWPQGPPLCAVAPRFWNEAKNRRPSEALVDILYRLDVDGCRWYPLVMTNIAIENGDL